MVCAKKKKIYPPVLLPSLHLSFLSSRHRLKQINQGLAHKISTSCIKQGLEAHLRHLQLIHHCVYVWQTLLW